jgi:hypothetical protein
MSSTGRPGLDTERLVATMRTMNPPIRKEALHLFRGIMIETTTRISAAKTARRMTMPGERERTDNTGLTDSRQRVRPAIFSRSHA